MHKKSITYFLKFGGGGGGQFTFCIIYDPNYPCRCSISSFMKIGRLIRKLRIGGGVGGLFLIFPGHRGKFEYLLDIPHYLTNPSIYVSFFYD